MSIATRRLRSSRAAEGRIFKTMGDGLLVEFRSVIGAVECAVAIQKMMAARNAHTPEARRIVYRIGVHLGDVLIDRDDVLGDGVNIAARLDRICQPGGISISRLVYDQIDGKLALSFRSLGLQKLRNITKPVEVFAIDQSTNRTRPSSPNALMWRRRSNIAERPTACALPMRFQAAGRSW